MTSSTEAVLRDLCACRPNLGIPLGAADRRSAAPLVRNGLAFWFAVGHLRVYVATDRGREAATLLGGAKGEAF